MQISIIVAYSKNRAIGKNNTLPWHISSDLKNFKKLTLDKPIIMGRKTYESIGRPLPKRENIVLTHADIQTHENNPKYFNSFESIFEYLKSKNTEECMIIGGAKIYKQALRFATKIYATEIDCEIEDAEAFFEKSDLDSKTWKEVSRTKNKASQDKKDDFDFDFVEYVTQ